mgnify:FL=1
MRSRLFTALAALLLAATVGAARAQETDFGKYRGVWAGMKSEAVFTDSVMMYFHRDTLSGTGYGALRVPSRGIDMLTTFAKDTILFGKTPDYRIHATPDGALCIGNDTLKKVESIDITQPYDMPQAATKLDIGRCLQEWQLGTVIEMSGKDVQVMVGTNRNSFMYNVGGGMVYLRAAAMLQCNEGSLFIQNIRMMKNPNTGERSNIFFYDSHEFLTNLPAIDISKFDPTRCVFAGDMFIYWSYLSHTPDEIKLNGCGETYTFSRPRKDEPGLIEWLKYEPYRAKTVNGI